MRERLREERAIQREREGKRYTERARGKTKLDRQGERGETIRDRDRDREIETDRERDTHREKETERETHTQR